jgi:prepilin-type N-terminal cleavage/methylation domain-containing protein
MRIRVWTQHGFGMTELLVVVGLIGLLGLLAVPGILSYWQTSTLAAGADELAAALSRARALAVTRTTTLCVQLSGTSVRFRSPGCAGTVWTGLGTDASGIISLSDGLRVGGGPTVVFTSTGGASTGATFVVINPEDGNTRSVAVATTGRVTIS